MEGRGEAQSDETAEGQVVQVQRHVTQPTNYTCNYFPIPDTRDSDLVLYLPALFCIVPSYGSTPTHYRYSFVIACRNENGTYNLCDPRALGSEYLTGVTGASAADRIGCYNVDYTSFISAQSQAVSYLKDRMNVGSIYELMMRLMGQAARRGHWLRVEVIRDTSNVACEIPGPAYWGRIYRVQGTTERYWIPRAQRLYLFVRSSSTAPALNALDQLDPVLFDAILAVDGLSGNTVYSPSISQTWASSMDFQIVGGEYKIE